MPFLEVACFNIDDVQRAIEVGAHRIELAQQYQGGGTTPSLKNLDRMVKSSPVPVHVLIRPRLGNFVYTKDELALMKEQIVAAKEAGAAAVVFGCLHTNDTIDVDANAYLLEAAQGIKSTFHRAFDGITDYKVGLNQLIAMNFDALLTAASPINAYEGRYTLSQLLVQTENKIQLICGGGVRSAHIKELIKVTQANWFHSACFDTQHQQLDVNMLKDLLQKMDANV